MPSSERILEILDQAADAFVFPMLDNGYVYPAASRLSCYCGLSGWAFVFETLGYSPRSGVPDLAVTAIGEGLLSREDAARFPDPETYELFRQNNPYWRQDFFHPIDGDDWFDEDDPELIGDDINMLLIRGRKALAPSQEALEAINDAGSVGEALHLANVVRALAEDHREDLFKLNLH